MITVFFRLLANNTTSSLQHLKRIADYLELGESVWYKSHETAIEFFDGFNEPESREEGPILTHFR